MEVKTILIILVLSVALPTLDTFTDINLVYQLFRGAQNCSDDFPEVVEVGVACGNRTNQTVCGFTTHPKMAMAMLTPFLLNYIVCFITFLRKEKNKKFTFIFALLNLYPQFGENNHQEKSLE